ncbi:MAG: HisA/HisF-related TIM barrel protein [Armatimonadota bacterium]
MDIIPGIDLVRGECVCPTHSSFAVQAGFSHDPAKVATLWAEQGARRLYLADLDGARTGEPQNLEAVKRIMDAAQIPVDLGGGIRSLETAKKVLALGVDRIVVGTTAALDTDLAKDIFGNIADKTILSVGSLNGYVAVRDWQARTDERAEDFASRMVKLGAQRIVFTDVTRKGMHGGVNASAIRRIAKAIGVPVIVSGGISSIIDLQEIKALEPFGVEAAIVVTALYSGTIKLSEALEAIG